MALPRRGRDEEDELDAFLEAPCLPDVVGVNHYLTSERFLDDRLDRYPDWTHGGNGRDRYADVEAVRVLAGGPAGLGALLDEAWARYRLPVAVTEVHLGGPADEQVRGSSRRGTRPPGRGPPGPTSAPSRCGRSWARSTGRRS